MNRAQQLFFWNVKYFSSNKETRTEVHVFYWNYMSDVHVTACYLKDTKELKLTFCWVEQITAVTLLFAALPLNFHLEQQEKNTLWPPGYIRI